jgi:hypothetical protein
MVAAEETAVVTIREPERAVRRLPGGEDLGRLSLTQEELIFDGERSALHVALGDIRTVSARAGLLTVAHVAGTETFDVGSAAETWVTSIRYPRPLMHKLGIKPGDRVAFVELDDPELARQIEDRGGAIDRGVRGVAYPVIIARFEDTGELPALSALRDRIRRDGMIWAVWPKGSPVIRENDIRYAALEAGLVDVKVVSFSKRLSGLKLVIPKAQR